MAEHAFNRFLEEIAFLEEAIEKKYGAQGETFAEKVASLKGKAPEKVVDDLTSIAQIHERAQKGAVPTVEELAPIKAKIDVVAPLVVPRNRAVNWIVWLVLAVGVIYVSWRFLPH